MSFRDAAGFLIYSSIRNRVRVQWRRLRQPKYLIFTAIGLYFLRNAVTGNRPATHSNVVAIGMGVVAFLTMLGAWIFGGDRAALRFTEPEVAFLFTAPVSRRGLVHFRLVRQLVGAIGAAVVLTIFRGRFVANPGFFFVGIWLGLSILAMHMTGAALTRASLAEHGIAGWRRRILTLAVLAAVVGGCVWFAMTAAPLPANITFHSLQAWASDLIDTAPLRWILIIVTAPVRIAIAEDTDSFLRALPAALAVLGAHYLWAVSSSVAFEEAADEASQRRARLLDARRGGRQVVRRGKPLFALGATTGPRWVAITWKNLLASTRVLPLRMILVLAIVLTAVMSSLVASGSTANGGVFVIAAPLAAGIAAFLAVLGPSLARSDLRMDLANMDLLRSYPLRGRDVVMAAIAAPATSLIAFELAALVVAGGLSFGIPSLPASVTLVVRLGILVALACVFAAMTLSGLVVQNALVLFLPGWVAGDGVAARGPEAMGRRVLLLAATLVVTLAGLLPASLIAVLVGFLLSFVIGSAAIIAGALAGAAVFAVALYFTLAGLGRGFERFDLSET